MKSSTSQFSGHMVVVDDIDMENGMLEFHQVYIKRVMYNDPATIVFWSDGTKTVSKCSGPDTYSKETGLTICILKKLLGTAEVYDIFTDWLPYEDSPDVGVTITLSDVRKQYKMMEKMYKELSDAGINIDKDDEIDDLYDDYQKVR